MRAIPLPPDIVALPAPGQTPGMSSRVFLCPALGEVAVYLIGEADYVVWPTLSRLIAEIHVSASGVQAFDTRTTTVRSSHGEVTFEQGQGMVIADALRDDFTAHPVRFDVKEWQRAWPGRALEAEGDILDYGYWTVDGEYILALEEFRQGVRDAERKTQEPLAGPQQVLKVAERNAQLWLREAEYKNSVPAAVFCAEQAAAVYKRVAQDFARRLADRGA